VRADLWARPDRRLPDRLHLSDAGSCIATAAAVPLPDACPDDALGVPGRCYIVVERGPRGTEPLCATPDALVNDLCVRAGPYFLCPGDVQADGSCTYVPSFAAAACPDGSIEASNEECWLLVDTAIGRTGCADPNATLDNGTCISRTGFVLYGACPQGTSPDDAASGLCQTVASPVSVAPMCPAGASGVPGSCYEVVEAKRYVCFNGELSDGQCVVVGAPPTTGADGLECPVGFGLADGGCIRLEAPGLEIAITCPAGSQPSGTFGTCETIGDPPVNGSCAFPLFLDFDNQCKTQFPAGESTELCPLGAPFVDGECRAPVADVEATVACTQDGAVLAGNVLLLGGRCDSVLPGRLAVERW